jgi:hypothetical protein
MFPINWLELIETYETRLDHDSGDRRCCSRFGLFDNEATKQSLRENTQKSESFIFAHTLPGDFRPTPST